VLQKVLPMLTPSEGNSSGSVCSFLDERLVELAARPGVNRGPTLFAVILKKLKI
jgi:hypothetical protein